MDILTELTALKADYSAAQGLLDEAKLAGESFTAKLAERDLAVADLTASLAVKAEEIASLIASLGAKDNELAEAKAALAALEAKEKSAGEKAVELVANLGIKPMKADYSAEAVAMDKAQVVAGLHAIKNPVERAKFYFANKATLFGAAK